MKKKLVFILRYSPTGINFAAIKDRDCAQLFYKVSEILIDDDRLRIIRCLIGRTGEKKVRKMTGSGEIDDNQFFEALDWWYNHESCETGATSAALFNALKASNALLPRSLPALKELFEV